MLLLSLLALLLLSLLALLLLPLVALWPLLWPLLCCGPCPVVLVLWSLSCGPCPVALGPRSCPRPGSCPVVLPPPLYAPPRRAQKLREPGSRNIKERAESAETTRKKSPPCCQSTKTSAKHVTPVLPVDGDEREFGSCCRGPCPRVDDALAVVVAASFSALLMLKCPCCRGLPPRFLLLLSRPASPR